MEGNKKVTKEQAKAANDMLQAVKETPVPGLPPAPEGLEFRPVEPERVPVGGRRFVELEIGESVTFQLERLVTADEADASDATAPLFHGIYIREYPTGKHLILNAHYQPWAFLHKEQEAGRAERTVYRITLTGKRAIKGGRSVFEYDFEAAEIA